MRKRAMQLIALLLRFNPFGSPLLLDRFRLSLEQCLAKLEVGQLAHPCQSIHLLGTTHT